MAGELLTASWQLELRGVLFGAGTDYDRDPQVRQPFTGLGVGPVKSADTEWAHAPGAFGGEDHEGPPTITAALRILTPTEDEEAAMALLDAATTAWQPSTEDLELHFRLPHYGHRYVVGRPRGLVADLADADIGVIPILVTFVALDPTLHAP